MDEKQNQLPELPAVAPRRGQENLLDEVIVEDWPGCTDAEHSAKLRDGGGLYLHQRVPGGQRVWRVRVTMPDRPVGVDDPGERDDQTERDDQDERPRVCEVTLGAYPELTLEAARKAAAAARQLAHLGIDGTAHKAVALAAMRLENQSATFGFVCDAWWAASCEADLWTEKYAREMKGICERWLRPRALWNARLNEIIVPMAVGALSACTKQSVSTGKKLRMIIQNVAKYAQAIGLVKHTELAALAETPTLRAYRLTSERGERHLPAVLDLADAGQILRDNHNVNAEWQSVRASQMCALLAQRPGNIVLMRWQDLDPDCTVWSIPRGLMKVKVRGGGHGDMNFRSHHIVPLPRQATELLKSLDRHSEWVFFSPTDTARHITENTLVRHYSHRLGLQGVHCPHGWRSTFSTWANDQTTRQGERRFSRDEIELILDHKVGSAVYRVYNRKVAIQRLRPILQAWADALYDAWHKAAPRRCAA
ncbi:integrase arm-type DNA-binding domain-containing protein [Variovorax sp. J22P240]|uniref:tyrosine-type recombinase/integrase n=1 Tax=Variovorax sp. J22P240 TaxID=3053514 RepID=UPI00257841F5|nr:site-specific integrase [Variovorax sp. J22P240]MDM0001261.1 integrase arm-type DNA-binding domain-containing protein [Variovorax sp. J22P240]